jgi:lysophospholipase L1-like esterase
MEKMPEKKTPVKLAIWGDGLVCDEWAKRILAAHPVNEIVNKSRPEETSTSLLKDFSAQIAKVAPDAILLAVGMYDAALKPGFMPLTSTDDFQKNLVTLVAKAKEQTERVYLLGLYKADEERGFTIASETEEICFSNAATNKRDQIIFEFSQKSRSAYIHLFDLIDPNEDTADGLHLNQAGYTKAFSQLSPRLLNPELIAQAKV